MIDRAGITLALAQLRPGELGYIRALRGGRGFISRLATLGFTLGAEVEMVQNYGRGPLIVMIRDSRVALGRGEAMHILVSPAIPQVASSSPSAAPAYSGD